MSTLNGSFGIDKLTLWAEDYKVDRLAPSHGWTVQASTSPQAPEPLPLHRDKTGAIVCGNKAHFNTELLRFDIDQRGLRIDLNPSKLRHPWRLSGAQILGTVEDVIQGQARKAGLHFDGADLRLSRLDLCQQATMPEPLQVYGHAYALMSGKRMNSSTYPNGAMFRNRQRQAIFYDKRAELIHRHKEGLGCHEKTLRAEARFMRHKSVTDETGLTYLHDLRATTDEHLMGVYRGFMARDVFRLNGTGQQCIMPIKDLDATFEAIMENTPARSVLQVFERSVGIGLLIDQFGGIDGYMTYLSTKGLHRSTIWRHANKVRELIGYNRLTTATDGGKTASDLVGELRMAFLIN